MAVYHNVRVPMPNKTYFRKQNDVQYVYLYTKFYRNAEGKSRNKAVNIGRYDADNDMLVPNDKYYELFGGEVSIEFNDFSSVGYTAVVDKAVKNLELDTILEDDDIINTAAYAIREGSTMSYIDDYMDNHHTFNSGRYLTSQKVSDLFKEIDEHKRNDFFSKWASRICENDAVFYDVTSLSTYSKGIVEAEMGYNRDHDDLKQINVGLFTAKKSKLPVFYDNYNGSLTDKTNLVYVFEKAKRVGLDKLNLIMDGGFFDEKRIQDLSDMKIDFTVGMPSTLDQSKKIIEKYRYDVNSIKNRTRYATHYAMLIDETVYGVNGKVLLGYCGDTREMMMESLKASLAKREKELKEKVIKKYETVIKKKKYTDFFEIIPLENNDYTYKTKEEALEEVSKNYGYFLVFTTADNLSADEVLYYYRAKDADEKMFYCLKNYMDGDRLRTHNQETTDGKMFVLFIGLIIRSYMYNQLDEFKQTKHLTFEKCMRKLENIKAVKTKDGVKLTKALTKEQREMLEIFDIDMEKVLNTI